MGMCDLGSVFAELRARAESPFCPCGPALALRATTDKFLPLTCGESSESLSAPSPYLVKITNDCVIGERVGRGKNELPRSMPEKNISRKDAKKTLELYIPFAPLREKPRLRSRRSRGRNVTPCSSKSVREETCPCVSRVWRGLSYSRLRRRVVERRRSFHPRRS